jgi:hypothetical protein
MNSCSKCGFDRCMCPRYPEPVPYSPASGKVDGN